MSLSKTRSTIYEVHEKHAFPLHARFNNAHHGFMKALKNARRPFMSLSKIDRTIYELRKNMHFLCRTAWPCLACLMGARRARKAAEFLPPGEPVVFSLVLMTR